MPDPKSVAADLSTADAIRLLAENIKPRHPLVDAGMTPEQVRAVTEPPAPKRWRIVACRSEETGATFDAYVSESRTFPNGRILHLLNYRHPKGVYTSQAHGGLVPEGMAVLRDTSVAPGEGEYRKDQLTPYFLQWRYEAFWKTDLRRFSGRELTASACAEPGGLKVPWQEGRVGALRRDDE